MAVAGLLVASFSLFLTAWLWSQQQNLNDRVDTSVTNNCAANQRQDLALAGLVTAALQSGDIPDSALKQIFRGYVASTAAAAHLPCRIP